MKKVLIFVLSILTQFGYSKNFNGILGVRFGDNKNTVIEKFDTTGWKINVSNQFVFCKKKRKYFLGQKISSLSFKCSDDKVHSILVTFPKSKINNIYKMGQLLKLIIDKYNFRLVQTEKSFHNRCYIYQTDKVLLVAHATRDKGVVFNFSDIKLLKKLKDEEFL